MLQDNVLKLKLKCENYASIFFIIYLVIRPFDVLITSLSLFVIREKILQEHPHLLDEIETEAAKMRQEKEDLENKLAQVQRELEEEKEKAGETFKSAFIDDDDNEVDEKDDVKHGVDAKEEEALGTNENKDLAKDSSENEEGEDVIDFDECCDKSNNQDDQIDELRSDDTATVTDEAVDQKTAQSQSETNISHPTKGAIKESDSSIVTIKDIMDEFREQVKQDFSRVCQIIFPVQYREPMMKFFKPLFIIAKDSVKTTYDMVKRYTSILMQTLLNPRNDTQDTKIANSNQVALNTEMDAQ